MRSTKTHHAMRTNLLQILSLLFLAFLSLSNVLGQTKSEAITIEIRNPDLLRLYPPVLRVRGVRRTPSQAFQSTLETLVRRGVLTPEEARNAIEQKP